MKLLQKKHLLTAGVVLALGISSQSFAASPNFTVEPSVLGGPAPTFTSNNISGTSSELITATSATTASASGWLDLTSFTNSSVPISPAITGLGLNYNLYATFSLTTLLSSGTNLATGSNYTITSLTYQVFGDPFSTVPPNPADTFTPASITAGPVGHPATVTDNGTADVLIGSGSLISGVAGIDSHGGVFLNSTNTFNLTAFGSTFFIAPVPFFNISFDAFNNTGPGVTIAPPFVAITNAVGTIDFARLPEPGSLAIMGLVLGAIGVTARRRKGA